MKKPASNVGTETVVVGTGDLLCWLEEKVAKAEETLRVRKEMARTCRSGTNAEWHAAAAMHPSTKGMKSTKAERLKEAEGHDRIAVKLWRELEMFRATLAAISSLHNTEASNARERGINEQKS